MPRHYVILLHMIEKLEKKLGKYAVKNLIYYILGAYVIGYVLYMVKPEWYEYIVLYPSLVMKGQVWRLFTWVCTVPQSLNILIIFMFLFYFFIGKTLEQYMGAFKYNLYIFSGWFFTTLGSMLIYWLSGSTMSIFVSTNYLNLTSFLAFAIIFPDTRVYLFGILPIKMKILAWIDAIYLGLQVISGIVIWLSPISVVTQALEMYYGYSPSTYEVLVLRQSSISLMLTILISFINFAIFFFVVMRKNSANKKRKTQFQRNAQGGSNTNTSGAFAGFAGRTSTSQPKGKYKADTTGELVHRCSVCGRTNIDHPELMFRYCSKCSGNHEYCQDHLFTHEHIK